MVNFVPGDLLHIVLSKLPVKSLMRLRCVSKLWLKIIDSSLLIDMHLAQTPKTCSNTIIVPYDMNDFDKSTPIFYSFEFDNKNKARKIDPPVVGYHIHYVHTCNGLISLSTEDSFVIWNPATRKHRVIDKVIVDDDEIRCLYYGFGYDHKTDDYKVVMFSKKTKDINYRMVMIGDNLKDEEKCYIYSLKTGSWRKAGTPTYGILGNLTSSVYANGAIHWIDSYLKPVFKVKCRMVAFDLATEKWLPFTMPPKSKKPLMTIADSWSLSNYNGSLYASCCDNSNGMVDLWVMKYEETKNNTWTKLFTIQGSLLCRITPLWGLNKTSRPQVLIHNVRELQLYDIEKKSRKSFDVYDIFGGVLNDSRIWHSFTFYETLVSV